MTNPNSSLARSNYVLDNYQNQRPFSSFLPGVAGPSGIPMWVFYTNRGQAITSFGIGTKDSPIMEFQPANKSYRYTALTGFRTFIKLQADDQNVLYEPFSPWPSNKQADQQMTIGMNELALEERHPDWGLQTNVLYFVIPGEPFAGLVRQVTLKNISPESQTFEVLDGMPVVIPFGADNSALKEISRTIEAWMAVFNLEHGMPFYRLQASATDTAEVEAIEAGHFALSFSVQEGSTKPNPAIVDPELVFGYNTALATPERFINEPLDQLLKERQITVGKTPCGFFGSQISLPPSSSATIYSVFGHLGNEAQLLQLAEKISNLSFLEEKRYAANRLAGELTAAIATQTASPIFDAYCRQTFLDNLLRGGQPILLEDQKGPAVYHIYTRKHGDPERDYNAFNLAPEPYSQGAVNYRDVNQNRRSDVLFNPLVTDHNIRVFMSLIQADGYNPLVVQGLQFTILPDKLAEVQSQVDEPARLGTILAGPFTPGRLLKELIDHEVSLRISTADFLDYVLQRSSHQLKAVHGEGYWVDHWTYNLDLIDTFLAVYPDRKNELLFDNLDIPFFDSPFIVQPRRNKYVLTEGGPRQLNAVVEDSEKAALLASRKVQPNWIRTANGKGDIYRTSLLVKLLILALTKFTTLDPFGMGVEMEAEKPGWYDAMNGLPGLFGSSIPETYALQRLLMFLIQAIRDQGHRTINLPIEVRDLMTAAMDELQIFYASDSAERDYKYWDALATAREVYRSAVRRGFHGDEFEFRLEDLAPMLEGFLEKVRLGVQRAGTYTDGIPPTYFAYRVDEYETTADNRGAPVMDDQSRPYIQVKKFQPAPLPLFLEGPVRALRAQPDRASARSLYQRVKTSALFDQKLKMYKVNASLADQPHDIGRARAFTPGWLENESIFLHMEYKYLLEVLRAGLYGEFYEDFKAALIPFQDPERYGRSPIENSSFLVSSAHPDESLHGEFGE